MERKQLMKRIALLSSICITALLLTSCGGKTTPVITKADPAAGIYLGGKLPGISEEMMKDKAVSPESIAFNIPSFSGSKIGMEDEDRRLIRSIPKRSSDRQTMVNQLNAKVSSGDIAGYRISPGDITLYSEHGIDLHVITSSPNTK